MSAYQYYEFQAIDRPLNEEEQQYLHSLSSRVELTRTRAVFLYNYSDFRGQPLTVLETCFDALLYVTNWGTRQLAFRFPRAAIDPERLLPYCGLEEVTLETSGDYTILNMEFGGEGSGDWIEGAGLLDSMVGLREDILRGDLRCLYLIWLEAALALQGWSSANPEEDDSEEEDGAEDDEEHEDFVEPPVPAGLRQLSPALDAFVSFFAIDDDIVTAAAEASPPFAVVADQFAEWIPLLDPRERDEFLARVASGEPRVDVQLVRRLREIGAGARGGGTTVEAPRRRLTALVARAEESKNARTAHAHQQAERARLARLDQVARDETALWGQVQAHINRKQPAAYDAAITILQDLRDLAHHRGQQAQFRQRIRTLEEAYANRPALLSRLRSVL